MPSVVRVMAALSDADVAKVIHALEARGYSVRQRDVATTAKVVLEEKYFRRIEKYSGDSSKWQEWLFGVCVAVGAVSPECVVAMEHAIREAGTLRDVAKLGELLDQEVKAKFGAELFGVLCSLTGGEANVVVRSVIQKGAGYCGFAALCMLSQRFNPKTPARVLQFLTTILNPAPVKDVRLLERAVEEWEIKVGKLKVEFDEEFSDTIKVAIITGMIPRDLQDMVFQLGHAGQSLKYRDVRDKVMSIASHRAQMSIPTPMDVGWVGEPVAEGDTGDWAYDPELEVDAVSKTTNCYRCGGWGHLARDCSTPEGKGPKGKGKSKGEAVKGWSKGGPKGAKGGFQGKGGFQAQGGLGGSKGGGPKGAGKGFGYQGVCWTCGRVGHKSAECSQNHVNEVVVEQEPRDVASVGGVWMIGQVADQSTQNKNPCEEYAKHNKNRASADGDLGPDPPCSRDGWRVVPGLWRPIAPRSSEAGIQMSKGRYGVLDICPVEMEGGEAEKQEDPAADVCGVKTEITVDSAADESVCPQGWAAHFGTEPVERKLNLVNASGGPIGHYGSRQVAFQPDAAGGRMLGVGFQVTDVKMPLMAVSRICEKGNIVQFGPDEQHNYIMNISTGEKLFMMRRGNSYVLRGELAEVNPF